MVDSTPDTKLSLKENLFSFFSQNPEIKFKNQAGDEGTVLFLRAHPATQIPWIFNSIIFFVGILFLNSFLRDYFSLRQILFIDIFFSTLLFSYVFMNFLNWIFNVDIVTSKRVIDIDFPAFLCKEMNIASLSSIEDTTSRTTGFLSSWFDYGDVFIQTAATEQDIEFVGVPKPTDVIYTINSLIKRTNGHRRDK